jgi:hypothetical protein
MSRAVEYGEAAIGYSGLTRLQQPSIKGLAKTKPNVNYRPTRPPRFIQIDGRFIQIVALYSTLPCGPSWLEPAKSGLFS